MMTDGGDRHDLGHAHALQRVDIGAKIEIGRRQLMAAAVARQEHDFLPVEFAEHQLVRRIAPRRFDLLPAHIGKAGDVVNARAADDPELGRRGAVRYGGGHGRCSGFDLAETLFRGLV